MSLKSTPIFLVISLISLTLFSNVYAYTDAEITNMYRGQDDNQTLDNIDAALHSGSLHCSDLPSNLVMGYCQNQTTSSSPQTKQTSTTQTSSNSGLVLIPLLMIVPVALILIMKMILGGDGIHMPRIFMKPKTKQSNVKQYATNIKEDDSDVDMSTLDHNVGVDQIISNRDYFDRQKDKPRTNQKQIHLSSSQKLLISLGLMKVKKK